MPPDDGLRFDDDQHVRPARPHVPEGGPQDAAQSQRRPRSLALQHRDLLAEREDLQSGIGVTAEEDAPRLRVRTAGVRACFNLRDAIRPELPGSFSP
jgi:hypothetical protein